KGAAVFFSRWREPNKTGTVPLAFLDNPGSLEARKGTVPILFGTIIALMASVGKVSGESHNGWEKGARERREGALSSLQRKLDGGGLMPGNGVKRREEGAECAA
ncbi:MAG: hypothetical protein B7Z73_13095, partial [Planctomycetia bacterium 21-64-5]